MGLLVSLVRVIVINVRLEPAFPTSFDGQKGSLLIPSTFFSSSHFSVRFHVICHACHSIVTTYGGHSTTHATATRHNL